MLRVRKIRAVMFAAFLCVVAAVVLPQALQCSEQPRYTALTILYTNDLHGHLFPFDYDKLGKLETEVGGAARRAALIRQLRGASDNPVLVMDAGDLFTRGPLADQKGVPDFAVMNAVPYDIMVLGNNDFKGAPGLEGRRIMFDRIKQAQFPVVSANVIDKATDKTIVPPYKIFDLDGLKVGVFGLTAQRVAAYEQARGLDVKDPITAARRIVSELQQKSDFIVALTHIGLPKDLELASTVPGIDVIIGGDSRTWLFQPMLVRDERSNYPTWWIGGTIVCQDGEWGRCVGKLDLRLRLAQEGRCKVMSYSGELLEVNSSIEPARDVARILWRAAKPYLREVGKLDQAVPKREAAGWVAGCIRRAAEAQVGIQPEDGVENGLKAGNVTYLDIRKMFPWVNQVVKLTVTGRQLRDYISHTDAGLAGAHMRDGVLYIGDNEVEDTQTYTAAIEDFYARTSPVLAGVAPAELLANTRDIVTDYVAGKIIPQ